MLRHGITLAVLGCLAITQTGTAMAQTAPARPAPNEQDRVELEGELANLPSESAFRDGYERLGLSDMRGTEQRRIVDERFAGPVARSLGQQHYGFQFDLVDLNGDGADDLVMTMRVADVVSTRLGDGDGAPTYVYLFADGDWKLAIEGRSMTIGIRDEGAGKWGLAFSELAGYARYDPMPDGGYAKTFVADRP